MITHEEVKEIQSRLFDSYISGHFAPFPTRSDLDTIKAYITQQEKKDELYHEKEKPVEINTDNNKSGTVLLDDGFDIPIKNEFNELKRDVARFLNLMEKPFTNHFDEIEYRKLKEKLIKGVAK